MSNIDRDDNDSPIPSDKEFAEQQAALAVRRAQAMQEMQEAEERLAEQKRKRKEEKERERKAKEEKERERKAREKKEKRERQERERLEKQRMEQECREEQERVRALEETRKADAARQKAKDAEVRKYLEDLESEALMKGKIFYGVQKILRKSAGNPSGATTQARGTLPGVPGERVTLRNSKGQTMTGMRNETRCGYCEQGNRACVAPDNAVSVVVFSVCIRLDLCSKADPGAMHPLRVGAQEVRVPGWLRERERGGSRACGDPGRARDAQARGVEHVAEGWQGQEEGARSERWRVYSGGGSTCPEAKKASVRRGARDD
jgi:hypothetical protein